MIGSSFQMSKSLEIWQPFVGVLWTSNNVSIQVKYAVQYSVQDMDRTTKKLLFYYWHGQVTSLLKSAQTSSEAHPASYSMGIEELFLQA